MIKEMYEKSMELAEKWADADEAEGHMKDSLEAMEADLIAEYKKDGQPVTLIPKLIKGDQRYKDVAKALRVLRRETIIAKERYNQSNRYQDNWRTKESTERQLAR